MPINCPAILESECIYYENKAQDPRSSHVKASAKYKLFFIEDLSKYQLPLPPAKYFLKLTREGEKNPHYSFKCECLTNIQKKFDSDLKKYGGKIGIDFLGCEKVDHPKSEEMRKRMEFVAKVVRQEMYNIFRELSEFERSRIFDNKKGAMFEQKIIIRGLKGAWEYDKTKKKYGFN